MSVAMKRGGRAPRVSLVSQFAIAEAAIYLIEGKNVKHASVPDSDILKAGSEG